jgi:hypothetical protein
MSTTRSSTARVRRKLVALVGVAALTLALLAPASGTEAMTPRDWDPVFSELTPTPTPTPLGHCQGGGDGSSAEQCKRTPTPTPYRA